MKNVLITGGGTGVGKAIAKSMAQHYDVRLFLTGRRRQLLEQTRDEILNDKRGFREVHIIEADHASEEGRRMILSKLQEHTDRLEVMVNNAGKLIQVPATALTMDDFLEVFKVNVFGVALLCGQLFHLLERGTLHSPDVAAHVVNISSMGGIQGSMKFSGLSAYSSSKGALLTLTECLAQEWTGNRVRVNALAIGSVETEMFRSAFPGLKAASDVGSMGNFIARFAMDASILINGKIIPVSSGTP